jgi:hypothetical protein
VAGWCDAGNSPNEYKNCKPPLLLPSVTWRSIRDRDGLYREFGVINNKLGEEDMRTANIILSNKSADCWVEIGNTPVAMPFPVDFDRPSEWIEAYGVRFEDGSARVCVLEAA